MRWSDREAIGLFENIKNGVQVTDNYGRLIWNFTNRGNAWRDREMVGLLTKIRDGVDVVDNYGRMIHNAQNRGGQFGASLYYLLGDVRTAVAVPVNTVLPAISGTLIQGDTLSATTGTWTNSPTSYAYQWVRLDSSGANPVNIGGATSSTYILVSDDVGNKIQVKVTATNSGGSTSASGSISDVIAPPAPTNSVLPVVSGNNYEGQTLSTTNGTWTNVPTSYTYQWTADGTNIGGATSSTYVLATGQAEKVVRCVVTAHNAGGATAATSAPTATVMGNPITIFGADLVAWYDANDGASITQSGGTVSQWNDKSGNNYHLLQADNTKQPAYSATSFMGKPGLTLDGSNDFMAAASVNLGTTKFSVFAFLQQDLTGNANVRFLGYASGSGTGDFSSPDNVVPINRNSVLSHINGYRGGEKSQYNIGPGAGIAPTNGGYYRIASIWDNTNNTIYADNIGMTSVASTGALTSPGTIRLGAYVDGSANWKGSCNQIVLVNRDATAPERNRMDAWLQARWDKAVCVEGDSIATWGVITTTSNPFTYAWTMIANLNPPKLVMDRAIGSSALNTSDTLIGGINVSLVRGNRPAWTDSSLPANKYGRKYILVVAIGANGFEATGDSNPDPAIRAANVATGLADLGTYCAARKTAGWDKVVVATILSNSSGTVVQYDLWRNLINAGIKDPAWQATYGVDAICDFASDAIMGVDNAVGVNPTYFADLVHPNALGNTRLEPIITATLNAL